ncbi:hypothetical protein ACFQU7_42905 [Pseudoroseomonas wenyumeiae]
MAIGDDDPVDQQFQESALMVEICIREAMLETLTEVPGMSGKLSSLAMLPGVLLERPLLRMEGKVCISAQPGPLR